MKKIAVILLVVTGWSLKSFAQSDGPVPDVPGKSDIRVTSQAENDDYITLVNPHVIVEGDTLRLSRDKKTYEGLCNMALKGVSFEDVDGEITSVGTAFLNEEGEILRLSPIFNSLRFVRCLK